MKVIRYEYVSQKFGIEGRASENDPFSGRNLSAPTGFSDNPTPADVWDYL